MPLQNFRQAASPFKSIEFPKRITSLWHETANPTLPSEIAVEETARHVLLRNCRWSAAKMEVLLLCCDWYSRTAMVHILEFHVEASICRYQAFSSGAIFLQKNSDALSSIDPSQNRTSFSRSLSVFFVPKYPKVQRWHIPKDATVAPSTSLTTCSNP